MQFDGGYKYPSNQICLVLSVVAILITSLLWHIKPLSLAQGIGLFFGLEGTVLIASSYTPIGLGQPQGNIWHRLICVLNPQKGTAVSFNQLMFFSGLFCLFLSYTAAALA